MNNNYNMHGEAAENGDGKRSLDDGVYRRIGMGSIKRQKFSGV